MYVSVALPLPLPMLFSYRVPLEFLDYIKVGIRVLVPFRSKQLTAVVFSIHKKDPFKNSKDLLDIIDNIPVVRQETFYLAQWVSDYYRVPIGEVIFSMFPPKLSKPLAFYEDDYISLALDDSSLQKLKEKDKRKKRKISLIEYVEKNTLLKVGDLRSYYNHSSFTREIKALLSQNVLKLQLSPLEIKAPLFSLNEEQQNAVKQIKLHQFKSYLLYGVTGSGKTEVYFHLIEEALKNKLACLILFPEIALTTHLYNRFYERFKEAVVMIHSQLTKSEREKNWWRIYKGERKIVLGSRSAVFAPIENLGLIIVDEEHEVSYKQEESPRYHARDVAVMRAKNNQIPIVLGSATPSLESFYNARKGKYILLPLTKRAGTGSLPSLYLLDMRHDAKKNFILSRLLFEKILTCLERKEQIILFLNRRGSIPTLLCESCGSYLSCSRCEVALTYYHRSFELKCHYCSYVGKVEWHCKQCSSKLNTIGIGTQGLEEEIKKMFPNARVSRLDADVAQHNDVAKDILDRLEQGDIDILIGTQMIAKGINIHGITLIGIIYADTGLFLPDFRAAEKTFQLIQQVAGRAGRGDKKGEVVIQTYNPEHYALHLALKGDFNLFYEKEMEERSVLYYPPYRRLVEVILKGTNEDKVEKVANTLAEKVLEHMQKVPEFILLGPSSMPIKKINNQYRWHMLMKAVTIKELHEAIDVIIKYKKKHLSVKVWINMDPVAMI